VDPRGGKKLAPPELEGEVPGVVRLAVCPIAPDVWRGRDTITITFQAGDRWATATANVFGCGVSRTH
jgi:hypothetical protein